MSLSGPQLLTSKQEGLDPKLRAYCWLSIGWLGCCGGRGLARGGSNAPEMQVNQTGLGGVQAEEIEVKKAKLCLPPHPPSPPGSCS